MYYTTITAILFLKVASNAMLHNTHFGLLID